MNNYDEKQILKIITLAPILIIVIMSIIFTSIKIYDNVNLREKEITKIKDTYIKNKNNEIKNQVDSIFEYISYFKKTSEFDLRENIKTKVYNAHKIARNIYNVNKDKTNEEILIIIKDALREQRFSSNRAYFFIHDINGNNLLYPLNKNEEGKNFASLKDINGYEFVKTIMKRIKNKSEGFDEYYWEKEYNKKKRIYKKITFSKYFEPLNISISSGDYVKDYEEIIKSRLLSYINNMSNNKSNYFFIIDENKMLLSHQNSVLIGKKLNYMPFYSKEMILKILDSIKKDKSYVAYKNTFDKNSEFYNTNKTSYIRHFYPWNWIIGTGYYDNELNILIDNKNQELINKFSDEIKRIIMISLLSTILLLLLSYNLSLMVKEKFFSYKKDLLNEIDKNRKKDSVLAQQSKMAAMGEMLANISHQWRQPLSVISTSASGFRIKKEFNNLTDEEIFLFLDTIENSTKYLTKTIDDFTNFFKVDKELNLISLDKIWQNLNSLIYAQYKAHNINIIISIKNDNILILGNELIQVLLNLLNNSKDQFNLEKTTKNLIFLEMYIEYNNLLINVKDNAGGIKEEAINRLFEPYFTTKHKSQGTGIGLYMCKEIVNKSLKGEIEASNVNFSYESVNYKGALLSIKIPINLSKLKNNEFIIKDKSIG